MRSILLNVFLFQVGWFACVLGAANGIPWLGLAFVSLIILVHLSLAVDSQREMTLVALVTVIGMSWDGLLVVTGMMSFEQGVLYEWMPPYWLIAMWSLFATTLNVSMRWLRGRTLPAFLLGMIGGPLAYYAGHELGAVVFTDTFVTLLYIGAGWALIMPILMHLSIKHDGFSEEVAR